MKTDKQISRSFHRTFFKLFLPAALMLVMVGKISLGESTQVNSNLDAPQTTRTLAPRITTTTTKAITKTRNDKFIVIDENNRVWEVEVNQYTKLLLSIYGE